MKKSLLSKIRVSVDVAIFIVTYAALPLVLIMPSAKAASISQSYQSNEKLPLGTVVSLAKDGKLNIEKTTTANQAMLAGVVTDDGTSVIDLQPKGSEIRVVNDGVVKLLASTAGGDIAVGDLLIVSPLAGVAMRDGDTQNARYVAIAEEPLKAGSSSAHSLELMTTEGTRQQVYAGLISAKLIISKGEYTASGANHNALTDIASQIAGKSVNTARVMMSGAVFMGSILVTGMLLQGSVRGTFISLGRNPLSRDSLLPALARTSALAVFVLSAGSAIAYIILST